MNCIAALVSSKPTYRGRLAMNTITEKPIPSFFAIAALRSSPVPSTRTPPRIGSQISSERRCCSRKIKSSIPAGSEPQVPGHQEQESHEHGERGVIDEAGLDVPHQRRAPADQARAAVDEEAVDHGDVADAPQRAAERPAPAGEQGLV